jgi:hypothetical protein
LPRIAARLPGDSVPVCCTALAEAFAGWTSEEATALLAALPDDMHATLLPSSNALAHALTPPDRARRSEAQRFFEQRVKCALTGDTLPSAHTSSAQRAPGSCGAASPPSLSAFRHLQRRCHVAAPLPYLVVPGDRRRAHPVERLRAPARLLRRRSETRMCGIMIATIPF